MGMRRSKTEYTFSTVSGVNYIAYSLLNSFLSEDYKKDYLNVIKERISKLD